MTVTIAQETLPHDRQPCGLSHTDAFMLPVPCDLKPEEPIL